MTKTPSLTPRGVPEALSAAPRSWNLRSTALPLAALVVVGFGALRSTQPDWGTVTAGDLTGTTLHGGASGETDFDGDGLSNDAEATLGTSETLADTDGDGFSDLEEFARNSDPTSAESTPLPADLGLNMTANGSEDGMRLQIALYFTDGKLGNKHFQAGVVLNGEARFLPWLLQQPDVELTRKTTANGLDEVLLLTVPFEENVVHQAGELSIFSVLGVDGVPAFVAAAGIDVASHEGVLLLVHPAFDERIENAAQQQSQNNPYASQGPSAGSIYQPIPSGGGGVPNTWNPGEICYQATIEVSFDNGVVTHEVMAADCIPGWDAHCRSDCSSSVGETFQTFDPLGLVGG